MKIALMTYFASISYGATLQTYATIKILRKLGHEVELVNYVIPEPPRSFLLNFLLIPKVWRMKRFRMKFFGRLTKHYSKIEELQQNPPKADVYLIGSDQTWNPDISREKARGFFLDFGDENVTRCTYAASFGKEIWTDTKWINKESAGRLLSKFNTILIRGKSGKKLLYNEFGIKAEQVIDPVLLFPEYPELTGRVIKNHEIVTFKLVDSKEFYDKMKSLSLIMNIPVRILGSLRWKKGFVNSYPESLEDWIRKLAGSEYVVTDSFHGLVISIIYHRHFLVIEGMPERFTRLSDLLSLLQLQNRILKLNEEPTVVMKKMQEPIDWEKVDQILNKERENSIRLLMEELS